MNMIAFNHGLIVGWEETLMIELVIVSSSRLSWRGLSKPDRHCIEY